MDHSPPPAADASPEATIPSELSPRSRRRVGWAIGIGVVVLAAIAIFLIWPRDRLPSELDGQPLVHSELLDELEESMESFDVGDFSIDVAFYGRSSLQPDYMVVVTSGPAPLDPTPGGSLFDEIPGGLVSRDNAEIDFSRSIERTLDDVEYLCAPGMRTDVGIPVTMCIFQEEFGGFVISTTGTDPPALLRITMELHDHLA